MLAFGIFGVVVGGKRRWGVSARCRNFVGSARARFVKDVQIASYIRGLLPHRAFFTPTLHRYTLSLNVLSTLCSDGSRRWNVQIGL